MSKNTGGPAFPTPNRIGANETNTWIAEVPGQEGMTLRDYFAAHASEEDMCVALKSVQKVQRVKDCGNGQKTIVMGYPDNARQIARFIHADQMLKAREQ